jgi:hypothetical protein
MSALGGFIIAVAVVALAVFAGVAIHELGCAAEPSHRYGPTKVIASAEGAGVPLSLGVVCVGVALIATQEVRTALCPRARMPVPQTLRMYPCRRRVRP